MADNTFDQLLKNITENPELMASISKIATDNKEAGLDATLSKIIDAISPELNKSGHENHQNSDTPTDKAEVFNKDAAFGSFGKLGEKITKNSGLLCALKPYLSKERGDVIDSVIKMAQIADLMRLAR